MTALRYCMTRLVKSIDFDQSWHLPFVIKLSRHLELMMPIKEKLAKEMGIVFKLSQTILITSSEEECTALSNLGPESGQV